MLADRFRWFMAHWPTGAGVVTALGGDGVPAGCTVSSMMSLSMDPPLMVISLADTSRTLSAIRSAGRFGVSVLSADQGELCGRFATAPPEERFRELPVWTRLGVPVLAGAVASVVCSVSRYLPCADHTMVVGAPLWQFTEDGGEPLLIYRRAHHVLAGAHERSLSN